MSAAAVTAELSPPRQAVLAEGAVAAGHAGDARR